jgi:WD40 repeat protein
LVTTTGANVSTAWNVATGAKLWEANGEVNTIEFDPSSTYVALMPNHEGAVVYDVATGAKQLAIPAKYAVNNIAFDDGGGVIVVIGDDGAPTFFTKERGKDTYSATPFERGSWVLQDAAFVGERAEDRVLMTTKDREVLLFTLAQPFRSIGGHRAKITTIAASPRHRLFASADASGDVKLWGYDGALLGETNDAKQAIRGLQFSHDGSMLVGFGDDRDTYVWNVALGLRGQLTGDEFQSVQAAAVADDDSQIATINEDGSRVRLWRPPVGSLIAQHGGIALAVGADIAAMTQGNQLSVVDLATGKVIRQFGIEHEPAKRNTGLQDLDRERLVVNGSRALVFDDKGAAVYELTGAFVRRLLLEPTNHGDQTTWELSAHYAVEFGDSIMRVHELATGRIVVTAPEDLAGRSGEISPDETRIVVAQSTLHGWELPNGAPIAMPAVDVSAIKIPRPHGEITVSMDPSDLVFSPNGKRMIVLGLSTPVVVGAGTSVKLELGVVNRDIHTARWSGDGRRIITQVDDSAAVWNSETGALLFTIPDTADRAVAIASDGERIATGSNDGTIRIWDGAGKLLEQIHGHRAAIVALAFAREDSRLVAQGADDETTIWDVHLEQRTPAEISKIATPWQVVGGALVRR